MSTAAAISHVGDYSSAVNLIVETDILTCRLFVGDGHRDGGSAGPSSPSIDLTDEEQCKVEDGECQIAFRPCTLV